MSLIQETKGSVNRRLIDEFVSSLCPLSEVRLRKYDLTLGKIWREIGDFESVTKRDLMDYVAGINSSEYAINTKRDYRLISKKFFLWLRDRDFVSWIRIGSVKTRIGPEDILTKDELDQLRFACKGLRDKAMLETIYETACRPHEFLSIRKTDVSFDDYGATVYIQTGKTGPRRVRVIQAAPLLANWIANHPVKDRDALLWVDLSPATSYRVLGWIGLQRLVRRAGKAANIQKRVHPYIFRHSRLTHLAKNMTEAVLCEFAGWSQGSEMPRAYVHLSGRDVDDAILKAYGMKPKDEGQLGNALINCVRCQQLCDPSSGTCDRCGMALSLDAALKKDQMMDDVLTRLAKLEEERRSLHQSLESA